MTAKRNREPQEHFVCPSPDPPALAAARDAWLQSSGDGRHQARITFLRAREADLAMRVRIYSDLHALMLGDLKQVRDELRHTGGN